MFEIGLVCGGPSKERGISLNSARSLLDHLADANIHLNPIFVDQSLRFHSLSIAQLYSNTPADFDFKLAGAGGLLDEAHAIAALRKCDLVFPCIHGRFGEDGDLQQLLEDNGIPFVGSSAATCRIMANKFSSNQYLAANGYDTLPIIVIESKESGWETRVVEFFSSLGLARAVAKPAEGGSSIGVRSVSSAAEACSHIHALLENESERQVVLEPFCKGREFTVVVLEGLDGRAVALPPTGIVMDYGDGQIFDYRRKYLPSDNTRYECPPNFSDPLIGEIRSQAEKIFVLMGMHDMARIDGWLTEENEVLFTDFNPISGMEQNSFIFQQACRVGFSHQSLLRHVVASACRRNNLSLPDPSLDCVGHQPVRVLFSGTNVWLKLRRSSTYLPEPYLLDSSGDGVWHLPYAFCLSHTVEEIQENCLAPERRRHQMLELASEVRSRLVGTELLVDAIAPEKMRLQEFCEEAGANNEFVFIALHGGMGEDGSIQAMFDRYRINYNGSGPPASRLCMDKLATGKAISALGDSHLISAPKRLVTTGDLDSYTSEDCDVLWLQCCSEFGCADLLIKPRSDGCSAGILRLTSGGELHSYFDLVRSGESIIGQRKFASQTGIIEMSLDKNGGFLIEPFIETDHLSVNQSQIIHSAISGWIELTIGVMEQNGVYHSFQPSIAVSEGHVLSLEEKFQGGTGINITPPPSEIIGPKQIEILMGSVERAAKALGISNYARLDVFFNTHDNITLLIEANSLPGLTPSTVIFHQAFAETPAMFPIALLERIISTKLGRSP
jgi:D-alanine--D-alanine ligase